ncbi:MAG: transposase family protein [Planctomycetes bacterium]|nr:transposase family protein [Planctomycetota bacterium]
MTTARGASWRCRWVLRRRARTCWRSFERAAAERGGKYPFVVQMDNGSENQNALVRAWAVEHEVILLFNIPHTPQHNARAERTNGNLRLASGLDKPTLRRAGELAVALQAARKGPGMARAEVAVLLAQAGGTWMSCPAPVPGEADALRA